MIRRSPARNVLLDSTTCAAIVVRRGLRAQTQKHPSEKAATQDAQRLKVQAVGHTLGLWG